MKKNVISLLLALALLLAGCAVHAAGMGGNSFTDVPEGSFYYDAVNWAVEKDITQGVGGDLFQPGETCNRAQVVTFLWRYAGQHDAEGESSFTDVPEDEWYADAVAWAVEKNITNGLAENIFGPNEPCNRAQVVTFLYRYAISVAEPPAPEPSVPDWDMGDEDL